MQIVSIRPYGVNLREGQSQFSGEKNNKILKMTYAEPLTQHAKC